MAFDPYYTWLGIPPEDQPADFYRLLGIKRFERNEDVISHAADKQMTHVRSFQSGQQADASQKVLNELSAARLTLLNAAQKAQYDQQLHAAIAAAQPPMAAAPAPVPRATPIPHATPASHATPLPQAQPLAEPFADIESQPTRRPKPAAKSASAQARPVRAQTSSAAPVRRQKQNQLVYVAAAVGVLVVGGALFALLGSSGGDDEAVAQRTTEPRKKTPETTPKPPAKKPPVKKPAIEKPVVEKPAVEIPPIDETPAKKQDEKRPAEKPTAEKDPVDEAPTETQHEKDPAEDGSTEKPTEVVEDDDPPSKRDPQTTDSGDSPKVAIKRETVEDDDDSDGERPEREDDGEKIVKRPATKPKSAPVKKVNPPDEKAQTEAKTLVGDVFGAELTAAKTPEERTALAQRMIDSARETSDEPATRYVLLNMAAAAAVQAGNGTLFYAALDELDERFIVDVLKLKARGLNDTVKLSLDAETNGQLVQLAFALIDESAAADRFDIATPLVKTGQALVRKLRDKELTKRLAEKSQELEAKQTQFTAAEKSSKLLAEKPDDAEANTDWGKYLCLAKNKWSQGLPHLAKSSDYAIKSAATEDLKGPTDAAAQAKVGDQWYEIASADEANKQFFVRAHYWYDSAQHELNGLAKARVAKRVEELAKYARPLDGSDGAGGAYVLSAKERTKFKAHTNTMTVMAITANGKLLATGSYDENVKLWDTTTGEMSGTLTERREVRSLAFSLDGKTLAVGSREYLGKFWNVSNGELQRSVPDCSTIALSADGKTLAFLAGRSRYGRITLWDASSGKPTTVLEVGPRTCGPHLSFDAKVVAAMNDEQTSVLVWNGQTGKAAYNLTTRSGRVMNIAVSPDGKLLAAAGNDGELKIWNLNTGKERHSLEGDPDSIYSLQFAPDSRTLATGGSKLRLWNAQTGEMEQEISGHNSGIQLITISRDCKTMATGCWDNSVIIWDLERQPVKNPG